MGVSNGRGVTRGCPSNSCRGAVYKQCPERGAAAAPRRLGSGEAGLGGTCRGLRAPSSSSSPSPPPRGHLRQAQPRPSGGLCREGPVVRASAGGPLPPACLKGSGRRPSPPRPGWKRGSEPPLVPALSRGTAGGGRKGGAGPGGRRKVQVCVAPQVAAPPAAPSPWRGGRSGGAAGALPQLPPTPKFALAPRCRRRRAAAPSPGAPARGRAAVRPSVQHLGGRGAPPRRRAGPGGRARPGWGCAATREYFFVSQRCSWKKDL